MYTYHNDTYQRDIFQYGNYSLDDITVYDLAPRQAKLLDACIFLVDNNTSLRTTARNTSYSKSTIHRFIHTELRSVSFELYKCAKRVLNSHLSKYS